jgi:hypothetical protein
MPKVEFGPALRHALSEKRLADNELLRLQQEIRNGKRACEASPILSALENCDDALEAAWIEIRHAVCHHEVLEATRATTDMPVPDSQHLIGR